MLEISQFIPETLLNFVLVTLLSLVIGLAQRRLHSAKEEFTVFGTDRTFTFIGILGFLLYIIDEKSLIPYLVGWITLSAFLVIYYIFKLKEKNTFGMTTVIIGLITYSIPPLVITQPAWLYILVVVTVLILSEMKSSFVEISQKFDKDEFITLAKFLIIAGVILPIIPDKQIVPFINITPFNVWISVVVISAISYMSYLLRKFIFVKSGIIVSGILGGIYSSTAATIILSRKSKKTKNFNESRQYAAAIILSITMMYLRVLLLMAIFNKELAVYTLPVFLIMIAFSALFSFGILFFSKNNKEKTEKDNTLDDKNPLEFKVAIIFTLLFIGFSFLNYYVIESFGIRGLNLLSWLVGITDVTPFLLNLFQETYKVSINVISLATFQAIISTNLIKTGYSIFLADKSLRKPVIISMSSIIALNATLLLFFI